MRFKEWLEKKLDLYNIIPAHLAYHLGISRGAVSLWTNGHKRPNRKNARKLINFFSDGDEDLKKELIIEMYKTTK